MHICIWVGRIGILSLMKGMVFGIHLPTDTVKGRNEGKELRRRKKALLDVACGNHTSAGIRLHLLDCYYHWRDNKKKRLVKAPQFGCPWKSPKKPVFHSRIIQIFSPINFRSSQLQQVLVMIRPIPGLLRFVRTWSYLQMRQVGTDLWGSGNGWDEQSFFWSRLLEDANPAQSLLGLKSSSFHLHLIPGLKTNCHSFLLKSRWVLLEFCCFCLFASHRQPLDRK